MVLVLLLLSLLVAYAAPWMWAGLRARQREVAAADEGSM
jgi:hypothetical protein